MSGGPTLLEEWEAVKRAIRDPALRQRCSIRTWQELIKAVPASLVALLDEKYGIR